MMHKLFAATCLGAALLAPGAQAKDLFYSIGGSWCTGVRNEKMIYISSDERTLHDGPPGYGTPVCKFVSATNFSDPLKEHTVTWNCDPTPPHEPGDKPTPKSKFYKVVEKLTPTVRRDEEGRRTEYLMRQRHGKPVELFTVCSKEGAALLAPSAQASADTLTTCEGEVVTGTNVFQKINGRLAKIPVEGRIGDCPFSITGPYKAAGDAILSACGDGEKCKVSAEVGRVAIDVAGCCELWIKRVVKAERPDK
jgi:hypothetical protein